MTSERCLPWRFLAALGMAIGLLGPAGCGKPNAANIALRKENQDLRDRVAELERRVTAADATIAALQAGSPGVEQLPAARMQQLFTTHGLQFGRLTGTIEAATQSGGVGDASDSTASPPADVLRVQVVPTDQDGQPLKAAGAFEVAVFELTSAGTSKTLGEWAFDVDRARQSWVGGGLMYDYLLKCPLTAPLPTDRELTLRISFTDELTRRRFDAQKTFRVSR
jgi:hypothetical protein